MNSYLLLISSFLCTISVAGGFTVVDQICALVGQEIPILQSEVKKRAIELGMPHAEAQQSLINDRLLAIYGKGPKFSALDAHKAAEDYITKIMKDNNLTREQFAAALLNPPYLTTLQQYAQDTAFLILRNQIEASIATSITLNENDVENALTHETHKKNRFEVYFISVLPTGRSALKESAIATTPQLNKAKLIRSQLLAKNSIKLLKDKYKDDKQIRFNGPIDYEAGVLKPEYDKKIKENMSSLITEPFLDEQVVTIIVRQEKVLSQDMHKNVLENVRNDLYKKAIQQRLDAIAKDLLDNVPVEVNCTW